MLGNLKCFCTAVVFCFTGVIHLLVLFTEVTTVTVSDVQAADDNVFSTSVAAAASIPEHVLVRVSFVDCRLLDQSQQTFPRWTFLRVRCSRCGDGF